MRAPISTPDSGCSAPSAGAAAVSTAAMRIARIMRSVSPDRRRVSTNELSLALRAAAIAVGLAVAHHRARRARAAALIGGGAHVVASHVARRVVRARARLVARIGLNRGDAAVGLVRRGLDALV